jgi:hypothetical protein
VGLTTRATRIALLRSGARDRAIKRDEPIQTRIEGFDALKRVFGG